LKADLLYDKKRLAQMGGILPAFELSDEPCANPTPLRELQLGQPESFASLPDYGTEILYADDPHFSDR